MRFRRLRYALAALLFLAVVLGCWEGYRRAQVRAVSIDALAGGGDTGGEQTRMIDPETLEREFQDPLRFESLCDEIRNLAIEIDRRDRQLSHKETQIIREVAPTGKKAGGAERHIERVWFEGPRKFRQTMEWVSLETEKPKKGVTLKVREDKAKIAEIFPFQRSRDEDDYKYALVGVEKIGESWTLRIKVEPTGSVVGRFMGDAWVDAETHAPVRLYLVLAEKKPFLDQLTMLLDYGPAQNGQIQLVRSVIDGSGGFAMIQKHIRSEIDFSEYAPLPYVPDASP